MKTDKIEELFNNNQTEYTAEGEWSSEMTLDDFSKVINQVELEWSQELSMRLEAILDDANTIYELIYYRDEIRNKIKEFKNG